LEKTPLTPTSSVGFLLAKFQPEKYDFDLFKGFSVEKMAEIRQILKNKSFQIARFL